MKAVNPPVRGLRFAWTLLAGLCLLSGLLLGQGNTAARGSVERSEFEVKAAFLLNFTKFVEWPPSPELANEPFSICIVGDDPFRSTLDDLIRGESVDRRPIVVRRLLRWHESCQLLFISRSERDVFRVLEQARPRVLTVGEKEGFLTDGGMINFVVDGRRVRFDISLKNASAASVRISSRLLTVARKVEQ